MASIGSQIYFGATASSSLLSPNPIPAYHDFNYAIVAKDANVRSDILVVGLITWLDVI